ncbi:helix-turn-helix domain-containing protein [Pseudofrankia sp. DC12]|uniref:IclR family transcriptional regulator n=1 Tax=Pseudofrankia sp. DC12 TaxID=683315 RepID=UPI000A0454A0|nr:helix-turn-helix domain-containing protein [Pseudofrankia sp. DC12]
METISDEGMVGLSRLARLTGLPKATVHRLLDQLGDMGAVERLRSDYRLGPTMRRLAGTETSYPWLRHASRQPCLDLVRATSAMAVIAVVGEDPALGVGVVSVAAEPGAHLGIGTAAPPGTAAGQVLLAEWPGLAAPPPFSDGEWRRVRADIRDRGVALDNQMFVRGMCCVAAAIRGCDGRAVASVAAMATPATNRSHLTEQVRHTATRISRNIAALPGLPTAVIELPVHGAARHLGGG